MPEAIKRNLRAIEALADLNEVDEAFGVLALAALEGTITAFIDHGALYVNDGEQTYRVNAYAGGQND